MATRTASKAALLAEEPAPTVGPPARDFVTLWVFKKNVAAVQNQVGWVRVLRSAAPAIIAAGNAVDPATTREQLPFIEGTAPLGWPRPVPPVVVALTGFTAAMPTVVSLSGADAAKLTNGDHVTLTATAGDPDAQERVDGYTGTVSALDADSFELAALDLSAEDVTGLTATAKVV